MNISTPLAGTKVRFSALLALALLCLMAFVGVGSAQAHDELVATTPAAGAVLKTAPKEVVLTFSGDLKQIGTIVELKDEDGRSVPTDYEIVRRDLAITPEAILPNGAYTLVTRVVSSDGHPIDKQLAFSVDDPQALESESVVPEASPTPSAASQAPAASSPAVAEQTPAEQLSGLPAGVVWLVAGLAVLGLLATVVIKIRRQGK